MEILNVRQEEKLSPAQGRSQSFSKEGSLVYMACPRGSGACFLCKFLNFRISEMAFSLF